MDIIQRSVRGELEKWSCNGGSDCRSDIQSHEAQNDEREAPQAPSHIHMSDFSEKEIKWLQRMIMRLTEVRNSPPFLVRDNLDKFIRELEALV